MYFFKIIIILFRILCAFISDLGKVRLQNNHYSPELLLLGLEGNCFIINMEQFLFYAEVM